MLSRLEQYSWFGDARVGGAKMLQIARFSLGSKLSKFWMLNGCQVMDIGTHLGKYTNIHINAGASFMVRPSKSLKFYLGYFSYD